MANKTGFNLGVSGGFRSTRCPNFDWQLLGLSV